MKFVFDYRGSSVQASVRGEYELKSLKQTGCNEFRSEPTGTECLLSAIRRKA